MKKITPFILTLFLSISIVAQKKNVAQPELGSGTIEAQFDYIINKSSKFRDFQLIRKTSILKVKANALDSIKTVRKELIIAKKSITKTEGSIDVLENEVQTLKAEIETISNKVNNISFLGISLSKSNYNIILWSVIIILLFGIIIFISLFKKGHINTKNAQNDLNKIEKEFDAFRKKAMLKEQETMRKLQNEINKNSH